MGVMSQGLAAGVEAARAGLTGLETAWSSGKLLCTPALQTLGFFVPPFIPATMGLHSICHWHLWVSESPIMTDIALQFVLCMVA